MKTERKQYGAEFKASVFARQRAHLAIRCFSRLRADISQTPHLPGEGCLVQRILGIPFKRARQKAVEYLEYEEIEAVLSAIDQKRPAGRRDYALLSTMFNTAVRVQEIIDLQARDLQLTRPLQIRVFGKGRKERFYPLWPQTAKTLRAFCQQRSLDLRTDAKVFLNYRGEGLTRFGVRYILAKYLGRARSRIPSLVKKRLHPHSMLAQRDHGAAQVGRRPIIHQPMARPCQPQHHKPVRDPRP